MALKGKPVAAGAAPEASKPTVDSTVEPITPASQPTVELDADGNAILPGETQAKPGDSQGPLSPDANENLTEEQIAARDAAAAKALEDQKEKEQAEEKERKEREAEAQKEAKEKAKAKDAEGEPVQREVTNVSKYPQRQHSTGLWIDVGETKRLDNDGWLKNQLRKNVLKEA